MSSSYCDDLKALRHNGRFRIETRKGSTSTIVVRCRRCKSAWTWPAGKRMNIGTRLHLLNHAVGHETEGARP